jgi:hypothetical protein
VPGMILTLNQARGAHRPGEFPKRGVWKALRACLYGGIPVILNQATTKFVTRASGTRGYAAIFKLTVTLGLRV